MIHVEQLNAIFHHDGFGNPSQITHPRAAHNLLGYSPDYTGFTSSSTATTWIGGPTPDPSARYSLYKQYGIMNKEVLAEDERRRAGAAVVGEGEKSKRQKKSTAPKFPRSNPLGVTSVGGSSASAVGADPSGPSLALVTVAVDVPTAVPVSDRPRGVAVPVAEMEGDVYVEGEDPEIEALFEEAGSSAPVAEKDVAPKDVVQPGILVCRFRFVYVSSRSGLNSFDLGSVSRRSCSTIPSSCGCCS